MRVSDCSCRPCSSKQGNYWPLTMIGAFTVLCYADAPWDFEFKCICTQLTIGMQITLFCYVMPLLARCNMLCQYTATCLYRCRGPIIPGSAIPFVNTALSFPSWPASWLGGQISRLLTMRSRVRFPALPCAFFLERGKRPWWPWSG